MRSVVFLIVSFCFVLMPHTAFSQDGGKPQAEQKQQEKKAEADESKSDVEQQSDQKPFNPYPLILLAIGVAFIFVMILYFKVNAFLALIGAALVVGLLSPEVMLTKPQDGGSAVVALVQTPQIVSQKFGNTMMKIGLAIAFATIIGRAMMESGSADRVVEFFRNLFGDKFAPFALLTSGFVLSIPVFFDTVFLLLIPLAKALRLRTGKDYLLYVTAIGAGGAVSHGLVPPTPGPIAMSAELHVALGLTIVMGVIIGFPMSLVGFAWASFINKRLQVPLRNVPGGAKPSETAEEGSTTTPTSEPGTVLSPKPPTTPADEKSMPPLLIALLPIVLPVVFITTDALYDTLTATAPNPVMKALDRNSDKVLDKTEIEKATESLVKLDKDNDGTVSAEELNLTKTQATHPLMKKLDVDEDGRLTEKELGPATSDKNGDGYINPDTEYGPPSKAILSFDKPKEGEKKGDGKISSDAFEPSQGLTIGNVELRISSILDFLGNPTIALLISAVVSMFIVMYQKGMTKKELGIFAGNSLEDAGMILLITSAGGAFGGMLQSIGVGDSLDYIARGAGVPLLVLAWGLAFLFKVAQGSGTVSMITSAQIMAGIVAGQLGMSVDQLTTEGMSSHLGYHPVYLVMAIGSGSKVGSWMNDSGFWVVCKMGGLTEGETFQSWTLCLAFMGLFGLPVVLLLSSLLPLV
ncbi:MAG: hypothetical protein ACFCD0_14775 [Gemmataceae bacterium]